MSMSGSESLEEFLASQMRSPTHLEELGAYEMVDNEDDELPNMELFVEEKDRAKFLVWTPCLMSLIVVVFVAVAMSTLGWITVRGEVNLNELSLDFGLFEICTRLRVAGSVEFDACQDTEGTVRTDSVKVFGVLFAGIVTELCAIMCFMYLLFAPYRKCCDMLGSRSGDREWYAGCALLVLTSAILLSGNLMYYSDFHKLVDQYDKEARVVDPAEGYARFSYSFFIVVAAVAINWISILFIVYEVIVTRRTRQSRLLKKRKELLEEMERNRLRQMETADGKGSSAQLGAVAAAELERKKRREEKRQRLAAQKAKRKARKSASSATTDFEVDLPSSSGSSGSSDSRSHGSSSSGSGSDTDTGSGSGSGSSEYS